MKNRNYIFLALAIIWMVVIFLHSAKVADDSAAESGGLILFVGEHFVPGFNDLTEADRLLFVEKWDHPVRKAAHMTEYAILAMLLTGTFYGVKFTKLSENKRAFLAAWGLSTVYAMTDEFHQTFVAGRSGEVKDVCFDSAGALIGIFLAFMLIFVIKCIFIKDENV